MEKSMVAGAIIVIIAIVLVAAYAITSLGGQKATTTVVTTVPAGNSSQSTSTVVASTEFAAGCSPISGFSCNNASISTYGQVSLSLLESTNTTLYNVHVACIASNTLSGTPVNASSWYALTSLGTTKQANYSGTTMYSGTAENIANLQCYGASGMPFSTTGGSSFDGILLLNYTSTSAAVNSSNPWITTVPVTLNLNAQ